MIGGLKTKWRLYRAWRQYEHLKEEVDRMGTKNIIKSKTFWVNVFSLAASVGGLLPEEWALPVLAVANIGLRVVTGEPVNLFGDAGK